ncbi:MAG: 5-formyltetrahydrofolate cyclo-ligase [Lachnospiraceae bacterium]|nr:5-formyltetrahydrofolate cyclo-ligase [Lachnospiraceae bacterium]
MSEEKRNLRKEIREKLLKLDPAYFASASSVISSNCIKDPAFTNARHIFIYLSQKNEPDTSEIIKAAFSAKKHVYVPRCHEKPYMDAVEIKDLSCLLPGPYGIPEPPASFPAASPSLIDTAIVPCVAATIDGVRLGHGCAYYDHFLRGREINKIALCFKELLLPSLPHDDLDVIMDKVLTEL